MPSGAQAFQKKQAAKEQQKATYEATRPVFTNDFSLAANQFAIVRFLEEGDEQLTFADIHRVPVQGKRGRYFRDFICLDTNDDGTPCPACQHPDPETSKRTTRGFLNLIWREGPIFQRDENKRMVMGPDKKPIIIGREDQIAIWKCSWTVFSLARTKDAKYHGLKSRDWEITRTGSTMNDTVYNIEPADPDAGPQPMTIADMSLAEGKYDLAKMTRPLAFDELSQVLLKGAMPTGPQPTMDRSAYAPTAESTFSDGPTVRASAFSRG